MLEIQPQFFDIFGIATFTFIVVVTLWSLRSNKPLPKWILTILLVIGILGLLVDGVIVYISYLR